LWKVKVIEFFLLFSNIIIMYIMYYIDKIRTAMENFYVQCTNCFYKTTEEEEEMRRLLEIEKLWEL